MAYTLQHTAESIDHKLYLIDENKNLLPYPYDTALPTGLTDVGDGSILTTERTGAYSNESFLLTTCTLSAGQYTAGLEITDFLENPTSISGFNLKVSIAGGADVILADKSMFTLSKETVVSVYLVVPSNFESDLLIKPQIEKGVEKTAWVPNMDKIGTYIDRRFNSTNAKLKVLTKRLEILESLLSPGVVLLAEDTSKSTS